MTDRDLILSTIGQGEPSREKQAAIGQAIAREVFRLVDALERIAAAQEALAGARWDPIEV